MNLNDPLSGCIDILKGYNKSRKVKDNELKLLYNLIFTFLLFIYYYFVYICKHVDY